MDAMVPTAPKTFRAATLRRHLKQNETGFDSAGRHDERGYSSVGPSIYSHSLRTASGRKVVQHPPGWWGPPGAIPAKRLRH